MQLITNEVMLEQVYNSILKSHYSFLLCRIKHMHIYPYLYGKEYDKQLCQDVLQSLSTCGGNKDYLYHLHSDHFIIFLNSQDPYIVIHSIYEMDDAAQQFKQRISLAFGVYFMQSFVDFYQAYDYTKLAITYSKDYDKYNTTFNFYDRSTMEVMKQQFLMMTQLERALHQKEFEIYLQAKVNAHDHHLSGAEALIRWVHKGNEVPLHEFMPLIDKNAFIRRIDLFVFEEACKLLHRWIQEGRKPIPLSVNISKSSFEDGYYYVKEIVQIHKQYQVPHELLEFELSEGICFQDNHRLHRFFNLMKEHGYSCSLDDFGSGYSSFMTLTYLPLQLIKLDSSFCLGEWNDKRKVILHHMITMLLQLGYEIIVEGVENEALATFFASYPTIQLQGYYFSKPLHIQAFEDTYHTYMKNT